MLFIVMAYCEGGDLDALIKSTKKSRQTLPEEKVCIYVYKVSLVLHYTSHNNFLSLLKRFVLSKVEVFELINHQKCPVSIRS
jgi:serine/threonine protein kinase